MIHDILDSMYKTDHREVDLFGKHGTLQAGTKLPRGQWVVAARIPKAWADGDGQDCEIDVQAAPARFYRLRVLPGSNSIGENQNGWSMTTGSGGEMGQLLLQIAIAVSEGMIGPERK